MADKRKTGARKAALLIAVAAALMAAGAFAWLSLVPVDLTAHLPRIKRMVEKRVAGEVDIERLVVKFLPSPDIRIDGVETRMDGRPIFGARFVHLRVSLLPLIIGHVNIEDIGLEGANIFIKRDAEGDVNLLEFINASREIRRKRGSRFSFSVMYMDITDTRVEIADLVPKEPIEFDITDIKGIVRKTPEGTVMEANAHLAPDTRVSFSGRETRAGVEGTGSLQALRLERFSPYLREKSPGASMEGTVDLDFTYTGKKVKEFTGTLAYSSIAVSMPELFPKKLSSESGTAKVSLIPSAENGPELTVSGLNIDLGSFSVLGLFKITGGRAGRSFALDLSTTPVPVGEFLELVPLKYVPEKYASRLRDADPLGGTVTIKKIRASVPIGDPEKKMRDNLRAITLDAALEGIRLGYTGLKKPVEEIFAAVAFEGGLLRVSDAAARYGKGRLKRLDATVSGLPDKASYELDAEAIVDVNEAAGIAAGYMPEGGAAARLLSRSELQGGLNITAKARGPIKGGLARAGYSARARLTEGSFSYRGFPLKVKSINAGADIDEKTVKITSFSAREGSSTLDLSGSVQGYRGKEPVFSISGGGKAAASTLTRAVQGSPFEKETGFEGDILYDIKAQGSAGAFNAKAEVDATGAYIQYKRIIDKPPGVRFGLDISAAKKGKRLDVKDAVLSFGPGSAISASGSLATDMSSYEISVEAGRLSFSDIGKVSGYLDREFNSGGLMSLKLSTAKKTAAASAVYKGEAAVTDGRFQTPLLAKPVEDIDASARFTGNSARMTLENLSIGETKVSGSVEVVDFERRAVNFELNSPGLYTSDLLPEKKKEPGKGPQEKVTPKRPVAAKPSITGRGKVRIAKGKLFGQPFTDLRADVRMADHVARIEPVTMTIDNGRAAGDISYHMSPASEKLFDSRFKLTGIDLKTMLDGFNAKKEYLTGNLNATVELSGARGSRTFSAGLGGRASLYAEGGRMWKLPVLADIFAIVNILSIDELLSKGLQYKSISGDFDIAKGVVSTQNIAMNSDSMRMSAVGEIDIPARRMDMVLALHPFVTIDKIISNIPLAGWLLTGKDESTVSMYFAVEGPFNDRKVRPMPVEGIAKGVFGILQRIIEAPVDILKGEIPGEEEKRKLKPREPQPR